MGSRNHAVRSTFPAGTLLAPYSVHRKRLNLFLSLQRKRYITCTEYTHFYGGKKAEIPQSSFRRLPFDHCSLSLQPFEYPVCTPEGIVFDLLNIVPWLKKFGTNPITGEVGVL
uniref:RING-type E3 ubiquitin-protein ligase ppil2 n=1 Tax=Sphaerodactylus townsendi TaxID=933632 RepID=A0ACB8FYQ5_9SAUR